MYLFLDYFFVIFHFSLIFFNLFGWIWKKSRKLHLWIISATLFSWFGLGITYGWGYCPFTDWHWQIKRKLGETGLPHSYIKYYLDQVFWFSWDPYWVDLMVVSLGVFAFISSLVVNIRDWKNNRR